MGNLLPLSQSVNSSLQNDSFEDKKTSKTAGRRGYENGSHSEIEVSKENNWTAKKIYSRSKALLQFMESRWEFSLTKDQMDKLIYVTFATDGRDVPEELPKDEEIHSTAHTNGTKAVTNTEITDLGNQQFKFWTNFVEYCNQEGRGDDIASRKAPIQNWYEIPVGADDFQLQFTITRSKYLSLLIYAYDGDAFSRLESNKVAIETTFGDKLDWYSSRENSTAKRIIYKCEREVFNPKKQEELFAWMIEKFDALKKALITVGEIG